MKIHVIWALVNTNLASATFCMFGRTTDLWCLVVCRREKTSSKTVNFAKEVAFPPQVGYSLKLRLVNVHTSIILTKKYYYVGISFAHLTLLLIRSFFFSQRFGVVATSPSHNFSILSLTLEDFNNLRYFRKMLLSSFLWD